MSRTVRNWCDICRDLQPDIACTIEGCGKKFHEDCLRNAGLWRAEDIRTEYVCPECRESNTNESFCYICKKELIVAKKRRKRADGGPPPKRVTRADTSSNQTSSEEAVSAGTTKGKEDRDSSKDGGSSKGEQDDDDQDGQRPRRSRRAAALRAAAAKQLAGDEDSDTSDNEGKLKKSDVTSNEDFVLCDGCSNSAHLRCLGCTSLPQEGDSELWFCTECDPNSATATSMARQEAERRAAALKSSNANASKIKLGGNVDICYVCQKSGKLLGCDFCEQAFHPRCIDAEFLEFEDSTTHQQQCGDGDGDASPSTVRPEGDKWRCPICKGEDPLKNMAHKRLSRTAMLKLSREWQECIRMAHRKCRHNRDKFLWNCRDTLLPFVTQKTINRLKKQFAPNSRWPETTKVLRSGGKAGAVAKPKTRNRKAMIARVDTDETSDEEAVKQQAPSGTGDETAKELEMSALKTYRTAERAAKKKEDTLLKEGVHLKSYQIIGVGWLLNAFTNKAGAILADEMGLGKTIQCLTFLSALKAMDLTGPHLIVVPLSTVGNWAREIRKFVPHLKFVKICGSRFEREHTMADPTASQGLYDLYITTYETVVTEESFFCDNFSWQTLILDEAHRIKNESGRIRHSLDRVSANMRVLLTGTPLQNNVKELFTLLNFLFPDVLKDSDTFERIFSTKPTAAAFSADQAAAAAAGINEIIDQTAITAVTHLLGKMMLRRTKDLVVRLPRKYEHDIWIPLSPLSAFWYKRLLDVSEAAFQQQLVKKLLGTVVKMRICCCHPRGLVTRDAQLTRFKEAFMCLEALEQQDESADSITESANSLLQLSGEDHIRASSKLVVLDKLLTQLHVQNVTVSEPYRRDYIQNVKDLYIQKHEAAAAAAAANATSPTPATAPKDPPKKKIKKQPLAPRAAPATSMDDLALTLASPGKDSAGVAGAGPLSKSEPPGVGVDITVKVEKGGSATEPPTSPPPSAPPAKPLTARQIAEKTRKLRAAQIAQQQAELANTLERIGETALTNLQPTAREQEIFYEMMQPAVVPDAPLPQLPEESDQDDEDGEMGDDGQDLGGDFSEMEDDHHNTTTDAPPAAGSNSNPSSSMHDSNATEPESDEMKRREEYEQSPAGDEAGEGVAGGTPSLPETTDLPPPSLLLPKDERRDSIDRKALGLPATVEMEKSGKEHIPHKALIFTQFQLVLDELERYCQYRGYKYLRLDGSTNKMIRELDIREFNSPQSTHLVYLICTRAGGVGINLVTANHVVLYDEDWNPFIDLQAIDRAHRIGQKRDVHVWKLITEWTVEERMAFRRMQKLKLDKLLIQANIANGSAEPAAGANTAAAAAEEEAAEGGLDSAAATDEKFSVEEIHRLIRHGRTAIQKVSGEDEKLWDKPLEDLLKRERRNLPVVSEEIEADLEADDEDDNVPDKQRVSLVEALEPEDRAICMPEAAQPHENDSQPVDNVMGSRTTSTDEVEDAITDGESVVTKKRKRPPPTTADGDENDGGDATAAAAATEKSDMEQRRATRRLRRRQPLVFQTPTVEQIKPRVERKIVHDKKCFRCGSGVNPADESADPLVSCHRCPKVYHKKGCLGFDEPPKKTWTCSWHECCLCFRKGSQAGGLLIHCAECPTTFCFDCFPPEYRRYNPPATYYADLTKRGYPATPEKLVLFLCSRCKALKEQARRRLLSRQQLEAEAKKRKEANLKARVDAQKAKEDVTKAGGSAGGAAVKQSADQRREFQQRKKRIDDLDKQINVDLRAAYERLYPKEFMAAIIEKREVLAKQHQAVAEAADSINQAAAGGAQPEDNSGASAHHDGAEGTENSLPPTTTDAAAAAASASPPPTAEIQPASQNSVTTAAAPTAAAASRSTASKLQTVKSPGEFLKLCENCHLPGHDAAVCPFVPETEKKNVAPSTPVATSIPEEDKAGEKLRGSSTKRVIRSFCPKCGVSSRNHFRRHCDLLTPEEMQEYDDRREKSQKFIKLLQGAVPVEIGQTSFQGSNLVANLEGCRRALQRFADDTVHKCLSEAGLSDCVAAPPLTSAAGGGGSGIGAGGMGPMKAYLQNGGIPSGGTGGKKKDGTDRGRRKRNRLEGDQTSPSGGDHIDHTGGADTDDPSYSPRKKSRLDGMTISVDDPLDGGDDLSDAAAGGGEGRATRRPRRANSRVNFRELDGEDDNLSVASGGELGTSQGVTIDLRKPPPPSVALAAGGPMFAEVPPRRLSISPRLLPQQMVVAPQSQGVMRRPSFDGRAMDMMGNARGPTFSTIVPPNRMPMNMVGPAAATAGGDQSRLPPSRWHHGGPGGMPPPRMTAAGAQMMGGHPWAYANPSSMMNAHRGYYPGPPMMSPGQWAPLNFAQQQAAAEMWRAQQQYAAAAAAAAQQQQQQLHHHQQQQQQRPPPQQDPPT